MLLMRLPIRSLTNGGAVTPQPYKFIVRRQLQTVPPRSSQRRRFLHYATLVALGGTAYGLGSLYPPSVIEMAFPRTSPPSPAEDSLQGFAHSESIERALLTLPVAQLYRSNPDFYETRPYAGYPERQRVHSLTAGTLRGPGKFAARPLIFAKWDESESVVLVHVGRSLCGHDGIVHGGLLATILDEAFARTAFMKLPSKIGVTAKLTISYRAPTKADQFIVIRTHVSNLDGRKAFVKGTIETTTGQLLVESEGLFVEPKWAKYLKTMGVEAVMGSRPEHPKSEIASFPSLKAQRPEKSLDASF